MTVMLIKRRAENYLRNTFKMADKLEDKPNTQPGLKEVTLSDFQVALIQDQELGRGAYGRVFKARHGGVLCAAKEIHSNLVEGAYTAAEKKRLQDNFIRECEHCHKLIHINIVHFIGIYYPPQQSLPVMIMELMDESLTTYAEKPNISLKRRMSILHDVAEGLTYLHSSDPTIIHRDLSPNNILLKHLPLLPIAKIGDLGVAKIIDVDDTKSKEYLTKQPGTVHFMPPEALEDKPQYDTSLDVFSYGGITLYTVNGKWPKPTALTKFDPVTRQAKAYTEVERRQEHLDKMTGEAEVLRPLVEACLDNDPVKRPSIVELSEKIKSLKESPSLGPALLSDCYELHWEECADLPSALGFASAALHDNKAYVMAGEAPEDDTYNLVYVYDININQWDRLPPPGQHKGKLQIIDSKLTVIGGVDNVTKKITNKVTTFNRIRWTTYYPNLIRARVGPGTVSHLDYVIVAGGELDHNIFGDDIEVLNYKLSSHWVKARMKLPETMWHPSLTISDDHLYIIGYCDTIDSTNTTHKVPVNTVTSSATSNSSADWIQIYLGPYHTIAVIPNSCPPIILGSADNKNVDILIFDVPNNRWSTVSCFKYGQRAFAIIPIHHDSVLSIGGCTDVTSPEKAKMNSVTKVNRGSIKLDYMVATVGQKPIGTCVII